MTISRSELDRVLGAGAGDNELSRARVSTKQFVRSVDQLAESSPGARGRKLTAFEALDAYGWDTLRAVADEGAALLAASATSAGSALRSRRELLGLSARVVGLGAHVPEAVVVACENSQRVSVHEYEKIARVLGLDERLLSFTTDPSGNRDVAVRLRTIGEEMPPMTPTVVSAIAEASWVAAQQIRFETLLFGKRDRLFTPEPNYGTSSSPAYRVGYQLAALARERLGLGVQAIQSLRELTEERLGIPVIQSELGSDIAGVTLEVEQQRAIVLNIGGSNRNVFVRRSTLAHELGHLLFDPPRQLNVLRVDDFDGLSHSAEAIRDPVEQRANAFSVEFIAPRQSVLKVYQNDPDAAVSSVMSTFGISYTAARYQIWNALNRSVQIETLRASHAEPEPAWDGAERYTVDYHPIPALRASRAGRFSAIALRAAQEKLISWETVSSWLECTVQQLHEAQEGLRDLFPSVWTAPLAT